MMKHRTNFIKIAGLLCLFIFMCSNSILAQGGKLWLVVNGVKVPNNVFSVRVGIDDSIELHCNTGQQRLAAFQFLIDYDPNDLELDRSKGHKFRNPQTGLDEPSGVGDAKDGITTAVNTIKRGEIRVNGIEPAGKHNWNDLELLRIYFKPRRNTTTYLEIKVETMVDDNLNPIITGPLAIDGNNNPLLTEGFELNQNFPNPFNPETKISYHLLEKSNVSLVIYDVLGHKVRTLKNKEQQFAGDHSVTWNALDDFGQRVSSGIYFYRMSINRAGKIFEQGKKMMLLK